ncbi:hypothetical protein MYX76_01440 [Desulfobacterota bacterium AH_259_B03_O07]|nr:hypothetical protein [Desulfobacterota bacterium AH_259_B03_O07]
MSMLIEDLRSSIGKLFSYVFVTSIFLLVISAFFLIIVVLRYSLTDISRTEIDFGYYMLKLFVVCAVLCPVSFLVSNRFEKLRKKKD